MNPADDNDCGDDGGACGDGSALSQEYVVEWRDHNAAVDDPFGSLLDTPMQLDDYVRSSARNKLPDPLEGLSLVAAARPKTPQRNNRRDKINSTFKSSRKRTLVETDTDTGIIFRAPRQPEHRAGHGEQRRQSPLDGSADFQVLLQRVSTPIHVQNAKMSSNDNRTNHFQERVTAHFSMPDDEFDSVDWSTEDLKAMESIERKLDTGKRDGLHNQENSVHARTDKGPNRSNTIPTFDHPNKRESRSILNSISSRRLATVSSTDTFSNDERLMRMVLGDVEVPVVSDCKTQVSSLSIPSTESCTVFQDTNIPPIAPNVARLQTQPTDRTKIVTNGGPPGLVAGSSKLTPTHDIDLHDHKATTQSPSTNCYTGNVMNRTVFHPGKGKENDGDPFGDFPDFDYEALDELISKQRPSERLFRDRLAIPPIEAPVHNKRREPLHPSHVRAYLSFSRYKIIHVHTCSQTFTKSLSVAAWTDDMRRELGRSIHKADHDGVIRLPKVDKHYSVAGIIHLRGEWYHTPLSQGDFVHVCSIFGQYRTDRTALPLILHTAPPPGSDNDDLILVVHPDLLLTPTTISEAVTCTRRAILKNRLGSSGMTSQKLIFGTMRHALFEECLRLKDVSERTTNDIIDEIVRNNAESLLSAGVGSKQAENELKNFLPHLQLFIENYTDIGRNRRKRNSIDEGAIVMDQTNCIRTKFIAKAVEAIEEPIISPELGLKGNVDVIFNALSTKGRLGPHMSMFAVEMKTGHFQTVQASHMAQLLLYTLMMQARYGCKPTLLHNGNAGHNGMLLYLNNDDVKAVNAVPTIAEMKTLIGQRNIVAIQQAISAKPRGVSLSYDGLSPDPRVEIKLVSQVLSASLPDVIYGTHLCSKCYANRECMMYAASGIRTTSASSDPMRDKATLLKQFTGHLGKEDFDYFTKWDYLIDLEADASQSLISEAWLSRSDNRESETAKSISSLELSATTDSMSGESVFLAFTRSSNTLLTRPLSSLSFDQGCCAVVSVDEATMHIDTRANVEPPRMHLVRGFLHRVDDKRVLLRVSKHDSSRIHKFVSRSGAVPKFRIDRDDVSIGIGTIRQNLINFFTADTTESRKVKDQDWPGALAHLREIVVRLHPPKCVHDKDCDMFDASDNAHSSTAKRDVRGCHLAKLAEEFCELNPDQQNAVRTIFSSANYSLIQGFPGTGKSEVITFAARLLLAHGKRVLVTAYTHSAVDNIMKKLLGKGLAGTTSTATLPDIVRVGPADSCDPNVKCILSSTIAANRVENQSVRMPSAESMKKVMDFASIVGVTALSIPRSSLLIGQHFDIVIVDEAGQISQPAVIGALMAADRFALVGDHQQLPPLVNSDLAAQEGFGESMLKRLADKHPSKVAELRFQYRMNEKICEVANDVMYGGNLKCANDNVRLSQIQLPLYSDFLHLNCHQPWLMKVIDPKQPVIFINTDNLYVLEESTKNRCYDLEQTLSRGGSIVNPTEGRIIQAVVEGLISCDLDPANLGVVSAFRAQIRLLEEMESICLLKNRGLEISTVDKYQGRDKTAIALSFVRSNSKRRVGRLLSDTRRINVAVTRAKSKLIMVGSFDTLIHGNVHLKPLLERLRREGAEIRLQSQNL